MKYQAIAAMYLMLLLRNILVRVAGIEPALQKERVFETRASTYSATPAAPVILTRIGMKRQA
tara:strand:+ start:135 stop:320 length:186 start_codon:yes stop_codon:yes gene_type:complete